MNSLIEKAYAKVNLFLEIIAKRSDGYHEIKTIIQTISLADELILEKAEKEIVLTCSNLPCDEKNLVYKAAELIKEKSGYNKGINIILKKRIPVFAGLGGGSSDAAATLRGLNRLWKLDFTYSELLEIAGKLGSDVPFFLSGGTVIAKGRGEKLTDFLPTPDLWVVVIKPGISISTKWAYEQWNSKINVPPGINIENISNSITQNNFTDILFNSFEDIIEKNYPVIKTIKEKLYKSGIKDHLLSGSGSSLFVLTKELEVARKIKTEFDCPDIECFITKTVSRYEV